MPEFVWYDYVRVGFGKQVRDARGAVVPNVAFCMLETGEVYQDCVVKFNGKDVAILEGRTFPAPLTVETAQG